ncbi:MAG: hypothetical protein Tsb0014_17600 [Pleurocapsa sp.]
MTIDNRDKFYLQYQAGKKALERGNYSLSIEKLEAARKLTAPASRQGGEVKLWLVTAYQAANMIPEAIALCEELTTHPHTAIRHKAQHVLYIMKAPKLNRPKEWMSEIPDLTNTESDRVRYVSAKKTNRSQGVNKEPSPVDLSQVDTQDNQFISFALLLVAIAVGSLIWIG